MLGTVLAAVPTVNESDPPRLRDTRGRCSITADPPSTRLVLPLDPPFPAAWDPVPRTLVRGDDRPGRDRRGRRGHRLGRHDGRLRGVRAPVRRAGSAGHRPPRPGRSRRSTSTPAATGRSRSPCGTSSARSPGCRSRRCSAAPLDGIPAYASCGMLLPAGRARAESALRAARRGLPGAQDPGRPAPARGGPRRRRRDARRGRRLDGDHGRPQPGLADGRRHERARSTRSRPARSPSGSPSYDVLWLEEPLAGTDLRGLAALRASAPGDPHRRRRDDPHLRRARWPRSTRTPSTSTSPTSCWPPGCSAAAHARRAGPRPQPLVHARTPGRTGSGCWPTCTSRPASAAGRSSSSRTTRPAGPPERRDFMLAEPIRPGPDGVLRVPPRRASAIVLDEAALAAVRGMTAGDHARPLDDWLARAAAVAPRTELFVDGRFVPAASGGRSTTSPAATGRASPASPRAAPRTSTARSPPPGAPSTTGAGRTSRRRRARRSCSGSPSSIREHLEELALLESLDVGKPIRDTLAVDVPSAATTLQWYAETIDKIVRRGRPDRARRAVAGHPRADRRGRRDRALELPADHHRLEAGRGPRDRQLGRAQAGQPVAADRAAPRRAGRRGRAARRRPQRRHRSRAPSSATRWRAIPASTRSRSPARPRSAGRCCGRSARSDVKAISLELGGKSPQVVLADVGDLEAAATHDRLGDLLQQRPDLQRRLAARRPSLASARSSSSGSRRSGGGWRPGEPLDPRDQARLDRRRAPAGQGPRLRRARARGGRQGRRRRRAGPRGERRLRTSAPTILDGVANSMRVAREEIFGPVLTVTEFEDEDEALAHRQRHAVRPGRRAVDPRRQARPPARAPDPGRHRVGQHLRHGRHHRAVRRLQAVRLRARQGPGRARRLHPAQDDLVRPVGR